MTTNEQWDLCVSIEKRIVDAMEQIAKDYPDIDIHVHCFDLITCRGDEDHKMSLDIEVRERHEMPVWGANLSENHSLLNTDDEE